MDSPSIRRDPDSIQKVADFATLAKGAEKGHYVCEHCGRILTDLLASLPNDGGAYIRPCPGCKSQLYLNAGWLFAKLLEAQQRKASGLNPNTVEIKHRRKKPLPKELGSMREEPLPDGRKRIIVTPAPANMFGRAKVGGEQ